MKTKYHTIFLSDSYILTLKYQPDMNLIQKVTIKNILPLYRNGQLAEKVELVTFEENQFSCMVQKGLYKSGDVVAYIIPDTYIEISEDDPFADYRSKMGGKKRVRAIAFNFQTEPTEISTKIYSNGILYPNLTDRQKNLLLNEKYEELEKELGLYKEDSDAKFTTTVGKVDATSDIKMPSNIYKTDETNIKSVPLRDIFQFPCKLNITKKFDGSSATVILDSNQFPEGMVGSRNLLKNPYTTIKKPVVYTNLFKKLLAKIGLLKKYKTEKVLNEASEDIFIKNLIPYLKILQNSGYSNLALRGELVGKSFKGSGNGQNPDSNKDNQYVLFNVDTTIEGFARKVEVELFYEIAESLGIKTADCYTLDPVHKTHSIEFHSYEDLEKFILDIFEKLPQIEGVVIKNESNTKSFKYMNDLYDAKK